MDYASSHPSQYCVRFSALILVMVKLVGRYIVTEKTQVFPYLEKTVDLAPSPAELEDGEAFHLNTRNPVVFILKCWQLWGLILPN